MPCFHFPRWVVSVAASAILVLGCQESFGADGLDRLNSALNSKRFVAYTPSPSTGFHPLKNEPARPEGIADDLRILGRYFDVLVTYSCDSALGLDQVVPAAKNAQLEVVLGVWNPADANEVQTGVRLARQNPDTVLALIVGNETQLFNRLPWDELARKIVEVRQALPGVPVTTSEPISAYIEPELISAGDFLAPICFPSNVFGAASEIDPKASVAWLAEKASFLRERAGEIPILIKEHGLPSGPGPYFDDTLQRRYWEFFKTDFRAPSFTGLAHWEAFDLPWKAELPGSKGLEAHWGWFDCDRFPKSVVSLLTLRGLDIRIPRTDDAGKFWLYQNGGAEPLPFIPYACQPREAAKAINFDLNAPTDTEAKDGRTKERCIAFEIDWASTRESVASIGFVSGPDSPPWWGREQRVGEWYYDLGRFSRGRLAFRAKGLNGGEGFVASIGSFSKHGVESLTFPQTAEFTLGSEWADYHIDLAELSSTDLQQVCSGFACSLSRAGQPIASQSKTTFFLDDIRFEPGVGRKSEVSRQP